jgi:succinyl-diaminopimelate desuccinylase
MKRHVGGMSIVICVAALCQPVTGQRQEAGPLPDVTRFITEAELTPLAQKMVQIRSDYDEGVLANHKEMAAFLGDELRKLGMQVHIIEPEPNYPTVIGRLPGTVRKPVLGLMAHYNTVPVGDPSKWTVDPFAGVIEDGRLYGRGATDQKMEMAAGLLAVKAIVAAKIKLRGDLVLLFIPGEGAQIHSTPHIVKNQPELLRADWYLDTEGGQNITKIAGGWVWAKIKVEGRSGHTGAGGKGRPLNAIFKMARVLSAIEDVDSWMTYQKHPLFPRRDYDGKPILEVGKIEGGYKVNQVPDGAEAQVDIRLLPGQSPDGVLNEMRALFAKMQKHDPDLKATVEPMTVQWVPMKYWDTLTDEDPLVKAIRELATPILGRTPGWSGGMSGGRPDLWEVGAKWVSFGIGGGGANAHGPDEYATVKGGIDRARFYADVVLRVLGVASPP